MSRDWCKLIWDLLFPRTCIVCGKALHLKERHFCLSCYAGIPLTYFWLIKNNPAEEVFWGRVNLSRVYSLFYYINSYRKPLHQLKYSSNIKIGLYLGELLAKRIAADPHQTAGTIDYIVPVPLHYRKKWKRGYNQSEIIAKGLLKGFSNEFSNKEFYLEGEHSSPQLLPNLLQRKQFTQTQTKKSRIDRWHNVNSAFQINLRSLPPKEQSSPALHILLVDDVLTTGATLDACAQLLKQHLNCTISIATLAYVE